MQVSIRVTPGSPGVVNIGLVAFEFGSVVDPHEMLQDEPRFRQWELSPESADRVTKELHTALMDKHRGLLGRRGSVWIAAGQLGLLESHLTWIAPWDEKQVMCPATLLWIAKRVPEADYRVPALAGLAAGNALHEAVQQAVLLQGAFRALRLNRDFKSPRVLCPPTM